MSDITTDLARNPQLFEQTGKLFSDLLERKRKQDFERTLDAYNARMGEIRRQRGNILDVDALEQQRQADMRFIADAAKISREYEENARRISDFNRNVYSKALQDARNIAAIKDAEITVQRQRKQSDVINRALSSPEYAEYMRFKRTLTPDQATGNKGLQLELLQKQIVQKYDPEGVAGATLSEKFELTPFKQYDPSRNLFVSAGLNRKKEEWEAKERLKNTVQGLLGVGLSDDDAIKAVKNRDLLPYILKEKHNKDLSAEENRQIGILMEKDLAAAQLKDEMQDKQLMQQQMQALRVTAENSELKLNDFLQNKKSQVAGIIGAAQDYVEDFYRLSIAQNRVFDKREMINKLGLKLEKSKVDKNSFLKSATNDVFGKQFDTLDDVLYEIVRTGMSQVDAQNKGILGFE